MKKLALVLAIVLVACMLVVGCQKVEDNSGSNNNNQTSSSVEAGNNNGGNNNGGNTDNGGNNNGGNTNNGGNNNGGNTGNGSAAHAFYDFSVLNLAKDTPMAESYDNGFYTATEGCKYTTSTGKTAKDGNLTTFMGACQLGKKGSFAAKSLQFTVSGACTVEVYANRGSSGVDAGNLSLVTSSGTIATTQPVADIYVQSFQITAAGTYALCVLDEVSSVNVWGIEIK